MSHRETAQMVLAALHAIKATDSTPAESLWMTMQESTWFEDAEHRLFDSMPQPDSSFLSKDDEPIHPMQIKDKCRQLLGASGYRETGWPALALFDHLLVTFGTGRDWMMPSGRLNVPDIEPGCGLLPCLYVSQAAVCAANYLHAIEERQVEVAARWLCKLTYLMTVMFMGCPRPSLREEDQPPAEALS
jgi:hypothetical protein